MGSSENVKKSICRMGGNKCEIFIHPGRNLSNCIKKKLILIKSDFLSIYKLMCQYHVKC